MITIPGAQAELDVSQAEVAEAIDHQLANYPFSSSQDLKNQFITSATASGCQTAEDILAYVAFCAGCYQEELDVLEKVKGGDPQIEQGRKMAEAIMHEVAVQQTEQMRDFIKI